MRRTTAALAVSAVAFALYHATLLPGFDFGDTEEVFDGVTYTYEDDRLAYGEQRFVTLGLLRGVVVSIVHTKSGDDIHVISMRKATRRERKIYFESIAN